MTNSRAHLILIPLAASGLLFLAACGNKGPLVMPQQPVPVEEVVEPAAAPPTGDDAQGDGTPPAAQDTGEGNAASVPDPVPLQDDGSPADTDE